jgi:hypothetical protein
LACITVTLNVPELLTVIDCVVAPLLQVYELPAVAVKTTFPPWQKVVAPFGVIDTAGDVLTVTATGGEVSTQLLGCDIVTVYDPETETVIACVVAPLFHKYELPLLAVSVTLPPSQNVVAPPAVMVGAGD